MLSGWLKKFIYVICFLALVFMLAGCNKKADSARKIAKHFNNIIKIYDKEQKQRENMLEGGNIYRSYVQKDGSRIFIVKCSGYEEDMLLSVVIDNGSITKVKVLYENESEGYGEHVNSEWFLDRFKLELVDELKLVKRKKEHNNEIIAITGATITSRGVVNGVNECIRKLLEE